jgi:hypothetical protein
MNNINRPSQKITTTDPTERLSPRGDLRPAWRPSAQLISEAVVAAYIHEIQQRHRHPTVGPVPTGWTPRIA